MKFDAIETGGAGIARAGPVGLDEIGDLRGFESARRLERDLAPGRVEMIAGRGNRRRCDGERASRRSEEHTSELQSLMRISYAVFCLKKKNEYSMKHDIRQL